MVADGVPLLGLELRAGPVRFVEEEAAGLAAEHALRLSPKRTARWEALVALGRLASRRQEYSAAERHCEEAVKEAQTVGFHGLELRGLAWLRVLALAPPAPPVKSLEWECRR